MIRKSIVLAAIVLALSLLGCATAEKPVSGMASDSASKRESVEELLDLIDADSLIDNLYSQMGQTFQGMGQQLGIKPSEQELFDKFMGRLAEVMKEEMSWDKMEEPMIKIYLKHYTEKEVQDQITFYRSESGQSMINKQADVARDTMMMSQDIVRRFLPKLKKISEELEAELAAERNK